MSEERWAWIPGFENLYEASTAGRIRSVRRPGSKGGVKATSTGKHGHQHLDLWKNGVQHSDTVGALVARTFLGPRPTDMEVRHLDGDAKNNRLDNLQYGTHSENLLDSVRHGTHPQASKTHCKRGHEFTPDNTILRDGGHRNCRTCKQELRDDALRRLLAAAWQLGYEAARRAA